MWKKKAHWLGIGYKFLINLLFSKVGNLVAALNTSILAKFLNFFEVQDILRKTDEKPETAFETADVV